MRHMLILGILISIPLGFIEARSEERDFEVISDVDYGFLIGQPKIPWGEDPFLKDPGYANVTPTEEKFTLGGVMYSRQNPSAVVNGKMVQVGDWIGSRLVKRIGENYVILKQKSSEIELTLPPVNKLSEEPSVNEEDEP